MSKAELRWVPSVCTLPTLDQPLRVGEFVQLFASSLISTDRPSPTTMQWLLEPAAEELARDLARRETECCSFFRFTFSSTPDGLQVDVEVPKSHTAVLDALAAEASKP